MARNLFNFDGGKYLTTIGATWFVSYSYYTKIDSTHKNWENVPITCALRTKNFQKSMQYHEFWLTQIVDMNDRRLNTNKIGLNAVQTKQMARELLAAGKTAKEN